jgi:hypothetical protein
MQIDSVASKGPPKTVVKKDSVTGQEKITVEQKEVAH